MQTQPLPAVFRCGARAAGRTRDNCGRSEKVSTTADGNGIILLDWLRLLGWTVEIEHEEDVWVGIARHVEPAGTMLQVDANAAGLTGLAWNLFIGAIERLEQRASSERTALRAA
jgi:hypothetical protein